jgi:hypothetical protein
LIFWIAPDRAFVPARLADNPHIDIEDYQRRMQLLSTSPVALARMMNGDWSVTEDGLVRSEWFRYYTFQGDYYRLLTPEGRIAHTLYPSEFERFCIVDCAGSSDEIKREKAGKPRSFTVITTFDFHRQAGWLVVRDLRRGRWLVPQICEQIRQTFRLHNPAWIGIERAALGVPVLQLLSVLPVRAIEHEGKGKVERFARTSSELERGKVFFPRDTPPWSISEWRTTLEAELLTWTGDPDEPFDQGDCLAYAGLHADRGSAKPFVLPHGFSFGMPR